MKALNYILALIILCLLGYFIPTKISDSHTIGEIEVQNYILKDSISRILQAESRIDTVKDTIYRELVAYKTIHKTDTIVLVQMKDTIIPRTRLSDTLKTVDFNLSYELEGLGKPILTFKDYQLFGKTIVERKLVPYETIKEVLIPTNKRSLFISYSTNFKGHYLRADYSTKKYLSFNAGVMFYEGEKLYLGGFGLRVF